MGALTRREFVLSAAAASAAFGLGRRMAISAPLPEQQKSPDPKQGFHRYRVGSAECVALYDGIWEKGHEPGFIKNASLDEVKQALAAAGLRTDFVPIPVSALVVKLNEKLVLCDAGGGGQVQEPDSVFFSGKLLANMELAGIDPHKIETILISHFHPDHVLGLLDARTNRPVFPNAEIIVPAVEYRWWTDPALISRLPPIRRAAAQRIQAALPKWKNVLPVNGEDEVVPGIRFVSAPGHTAGHTAFHLSSGNAQLLISGDTAYVPALFATHPGWQLGYDQDGKEAVETRRRLLDRVVTDSMLICGTHFPWPGVGTIAKEGAGYAFIL
jgi:glyoxylase-like metal-dependent hydrolase (beta-lactamase superfamily II)